MKKIDWLELGLDVSVTLFVAAVVFLIACVALAEINNQI